MPKMTEISRSMAQKAVSLKNADEAIEYLKENPPFRTLRDILMAADKEKLPELELRKKIAGGICAHHPQKNRENEERKIRNWFTGKTRSIGRDMAFELCLILGLNAEAANDFMMRVSGEGIHWRNPQEIVWGYAFEHGLDYGETMELMAEAKKLTPKKDTAASVRTHSVREDVLASLQGTKEELIAFLKSRREQWGVFHNEAYALFMTYTNLLEMAMADKAEYEAKKQALADAKRDKLATSVRAEKKQSVEKILQTYFFSERIADSAHSEHIHKSIRANWPDETTFSKMKNRTDGVDVSRKVLIMLFLATNGEATAYQNRDRLFDDAPKTREKFFRDVYRRLNMMLGRCGFSRLDPRSPFDWIVLYSISARDTWEEDARLTEVFEKLFSIEEDAGDEEGGGSEKQDN